MEGVKLSLQCNKREGVKLSLQCNKREWEPNYPFQVIRGRESMLLQCNKREGDKLSLQDNQREGSKYPYNVITGRGIQTIPSR
jgi:hypothetical protein